MISDVPVGFLLSGGVDSTVVLDCAVEGATNKISTFTVGFENAAFEDERVYARLAAQRYNTNHHEITITPKEFWDFLPSLVWHMEEPVCDPPAVSLHYVSQLARKHVKVLLSGEGGDEAFGGYMDYRNFLMLERIKKSLGPMKGALAATLSLANAIKPLRKAGKFSPFVTTKPSEYYYSRTSSPFNYFNRNKAELYTSGFFGQVRNDRSVDVIHDLFSRVQHEPLLNQLQYIDTKTSLPEDLLIKADRITMANSLELRVPFLDHEVLEFAAALPTQFRVNGLQTKRVLREAFGNRIPKEIIQRKKAGFPIPIATWTQNELREPVRDMLLSKRALDRGYFNKRGVEQLLQLGDQGRPLAKEIFSLLTLELLFNQFVDN